MQAETQNSSPVFTPQHIRPESRQKFVQHQLLISFLWDLWNETKSRDAMRTLVGIKGASDVLFEVSR